MSSNLTPYHLSESEAAGILVTRTVELPKKLAASIKINFPKFPEPNLEYRFCRDIVGDEAGVRERLAEKGLKDWRFDLAWPIYMIAAEVEGGAFTEGRHVRGRGFTNDLEKYGWAAHYGWTVYRCDADMIKSGMAMYHLSTIIKRAKRTIEVSERYEKATEYNL